SRIEIDSAAQVRRMRLLTRREPLQFEDYPANLPEGFTGALAPFMYCGVIVAEPEVLKQTPAQPEWSLMSGLFAPMVAGGAQVFGYVHRGYFRTIDDLRSYDALRAEFASPLTRPAVADW
ncbi:MAG TPA: hypothetical protein VMT58_05545, partial [Candidatus Binataceae bacterium]|nr:hypothetical protein [Candidatus Binataceae bacterium]